MSVNEHREFATAVHARDGGICWFSGEDNDVVLQQTHTVRETISLWQGI